MDIAYLHVVINHLPIMGVPIALGLLLFGLWTRDDSVKRAALLVFVVLGLLTVPVFLTGQGGEDFVEHAPGVADDLIDAHEDMATRAFVAVGVLATLSLLLFLRYGGVATLRRRVVPGIGVPGAACGLVVLVAIGTCALLGLTGKLGGRISHTEFAIGADDARGDRHEEGEDDDDGRHRRRRGRD